VIYTQPYLGVVFDMDGVLADSEPVYYAAINEVLRPIGKQMSPELQRSIMGYGVAETWSALARELGLEGPTDELVAEYDRTLCRLLAEVHEPLPGVRELVTALTKLVIPYGLASSSWPGWIEALLEGIGLTEAFDKRVSAAMVENGKPAPDIYLLAAERIGVAPVRCIAIEDTRTGLLAARAAGMLAIQVRSASTAFPPLAEADIVLDSLRDFDLRLLGKVHSASDSA
jgi:HAD superfamily hydrolase (TIGR01509 family)